MEWCTTFVPLRELTPEIPTGNRAPAVTELMTVVASERTNTNGHHDRTAGVGTARTRIEFTSRDSPRVGYTANDKCWSFVIMLSRVG